MHRLKSAMCAGIVLVTGLSFASAQPADDAQKLQGAWTAVKADNNGKAAADGKTGSASKSMDAHAAPTNGATVTNPGNDKGSGTTAPAASSPNAPH